MPFGAPALALYRNERDSVAFHRDRELRWLDDTVIAVLTFGARRPWLLKPLTGRRNDVDDDLAGAIDFAPGSGDLLVMGGATQARWLHAVPKVRGRCRTRISVQWRYTSRRGKRDTNPSFYAARHFSKARWSGGRSAQPQRLQPLDDRGVGQAAAFAHRLQAVAAARALELVEQRGQQPGARSAERVTEGDRPAVDVDACPGRP